MNDVHLPKVGLRRVFGDSRAMFHGRSRVRIANHAAAGNQLDAVDGSFENVASTFCGRRSPAVSAYRRQSSALSASQPMRLTGVSRTWSEGPQPGHPEPGAAAYLIVCRTRLFQPVDDKPASISRLSQALSVRVNLGTRKRGSRCLRLSGGLEGPLEMSPFIGRK